MAFISPYFLYYFAPLAVFAQPERCARSKLISYNAMKTSLKQLYSVLYIAGVGSTVAITIIPIVLAAVACAILGIIITVYIRWKRGITFIMLMQCIKINV